MFDTRSLKRFIERSRSEERSVANMPSTTALYSFCKASLSLMGTKPIWLQRRWNSLTISKPPALISAAFISSIRARLSLRFSSCSESTDEKCADLRSKNLSHAARKRFHTASEWRRATGPTCFQRAWSAMSSSVACFQSSDTANASASAHNSCFKARLCSISFLTPA